MTDQFPFSTTFLTALRTEARALGTAERERSGKQWSLGTLALNEWNRIDSELEGEINKGYFDTETARRINEEVGFHVVTGETLRHWMATCEYFSQYNMKELKSKLTFDFFRTARTIAGWEHVKLSAIDVLNDAYQNGYTVEEMRTAHSKSGFEPPHLYDKATGWLDAFSTSLKDMEWIPKEKRERANKILAELRQIVGER